VVHKKGDTMCNLFENIPHTVKGTALMIAGLLLLLHTLGVLTSWIYYFLIGGSIFMIVYGFFLAGLPHKIECLISKQEDNH
jgi:hypothetical protein